MAIPQQPLGPVPATLLRDEPTEDGIWKRWLEALRNRVVLAGQLDHNTLLNLQGGTTDQYYHLTSAQHAGLTGVADTQIFYSNAGIAAGSANLVWNNANSQLRLAGTGSSAGILIGGDAQLYRSAADVLRTPDSLQVDLTSILTGNVRIGSTVAPTVTLDVTGTATISSNSFAGGIGGFGITSLSQAERRFSEALIVAALSDVGGLSLCNYANSATQAMLIDFNKSRATSFGAHTIVQNGDLLGGLVGRGSNGSAFVNAAAIAFEVDGTPGAGNDMPGRIIFSTSPDGSATATERLRIAQNGRATFANDVTITADLAVNGGDLTSTATTFNLLNATVTTLNIGGGATAAVNIGNASGPITLTGSNTSRIPNGVQIGAASSNNLLDDASNGAGSATLYIGNQSILVSNGVNFGPGAVSSITVVNGQITAIS